MKNSITLLLLFMFLSSSFGILGAWSIIPNYYNYVNVSVNSFNSTFPFNAVTNLNIGKTSFIYFNTSFNSVLASTPLKYITIIGYSSTSGFVGYVNAFPYPTNNGFLISNQTTNGHTYNSLTIWFNQHTTLNTYLNNFTQNNIFYENSNRVRTNSTTSGIIGYTPDEFIYYNTSGISQKVIEGVTFLQNKTNNLTSYLSVYYNLTAPYILMSQNNNVNYTITYIPLQFGFNKASIKANTIKDSLVNFGLSGFNTLNAINQNATFIYLFPITSGVLYSTKQYELLSRDLGINQSNDNLFNFSTNQNNLFGFFLQNSANKQNFEYLLNINMTNKSWSNTYLGAFPSSVNNYYLIPAYSGNYVRSSVISLGSNAIINNNSTTNDTYIGWFGDYNYREQVNVSSWNFSFTTKSAPYSIGNNIKLNYNAGYLLLNLTHYSHMGANCQYVNFWAFNNITGNLGQIPYEVYNCSSFTSYASFILSNKTTLGFTYNSFYIYWGSRGNRTGYDTPTILSTWTFSYSNPTNTTLPYNSLVFTISKALNTNSFIGYINPSGAIYNFLWLTGSSSGVNTGSSRVLMFPPPAPIYTLSDTLPGERTFVITNDSIYGIGLFLKGNAYGALGGTKLSNENTVNSYGCNNNGCGYQNPPNIKIAETGLNISFRQFYSSTYIIGNIQYYINYTKSPTNNGSVSEGQPLGNTTPFNNNVVLNVNTSLVNSNGILYNNGLGKNTNFYGFVIPKYYLAIIILIIFLIAIGLSHDERPQLVFLGFAWLIGLWLIPIEIIAIIITLIYAMYRLNKHK